MVSHFLLFCIRSESSSNGIGGQAVQLGAFVGLLARTDNCYGWAPLPPPADFVAGAGISIGGAAVAANFDFGLSRKIYFGTT